MDVYIKNTQRCQLARKECPAIVEYVSIKSQILANINNINKTKRDLIGLGMLEISERKRLNDIFNSYMENSKALENKARDLNSKIREEINNLKNYDVYCKDSLSDVEFYQKIDNSSNIAVEAIENDIENVEGNLVEKIPDIDDWLYEYIYS